MGNLKERVLSSEDVTAFGRYLALLVEKEYAYEIVDQIGKAKNADDFIEGIWKAMRLSKKLENQYKELIPTSDNIKRVLSFIEEDSKILKFLSRYLGSLAFTIWPEIERAKKEAGGEK